ncbi:aminotransferase class I/II-fold pyridoxal phosphate-dependent enzyme [Muriicola sp. Z0-33]|uniref:aminotransferase class I/II-fold pyridoxal phosphate-dependent enzyme n=1 Tax=Muriicola sp. Z0-33 TaxID=2816957 RepID=UPI0022370A7B|nr:pyridoxal phosphate-dependent aminotransferase family protein [Muriicola sp. Z0-33]MCW5514953.1 pyridoxal phosphate-dependent aminotransferase family protein [Muriicola sp. Z0-33]
MARLPKKLQQKLEERRADNTLRELPSETSLVDFSSNDYLGFSQNMALSHLALQILSDKELARNGATGSRLLTGNNILFDEVEELISTYHNAENALIFNSGYDANIGFFSSVPQRNDIVFFDEFIHASIRDGLKLGNARAFKFKHNNLEDLSSCIAQQKHQLDGGDNQAYLVTEAVFSMDGDTSDLHKLMEICESNDILLILDEAHAVGVFGKGGKGRISDLHLEDRVFARMITFGKALGCHGAAILGTNALKNYLVNFARSLIYTTALPPHSLASILAAYKLLSSDLGSQQIIKLRENIDYFKELLTGMRLSTYFIKSDSAIHCCILGGSTLVKQTALALSHQGMDVKPILYPTVPKGKERLRFCLHSFNSKQEIQEVLKTLKAIITKSPSLARGN